MAGAAVEPVGEIVKTQRTNRPLLLLVGIATAAVILAIPTPAHATGGAIEIDGAGWGHGVGMCQWGAIEMGRKGATETEILRYYYPGVSFTKVY